MNGYTRYVLRQLLIGLLFVTVGLTAIIWLSQSLRFVELIVNRGVSAGTFVYLTFLLLPNFLTIILPIALFTVVVFTFAKLIGDRELVIMRAAGLGQMSLTKPALLLALAITAFLYLLNLYFLPESYRAFRELQWDIRNTYSHILLREGAFNNISQRFTVYVREHSSEGELLGVLAHDGKDKATYMAERGALVEADNGARVVLYKGNRQTIDPKTRKLAILYFDRYVLDMKWSQESADDRFREPRERTTGELWFLDRQDDVDQNDYGKYVVELHKRLTNPLLALGFTFVALACLISGGFSRRTQTHRIVAAIVLMVVLQAGQLGLENFLAKRHEIVSLLYVYVLIPIVVGAYGMVRQPRYKPQSPPAAGATA